MKYFEEAKKLWKSSVPRRGQAETVQGELLRAVEKLRDEAQRNGNANWDDGHRILLAFLRSVLLSSDLFDRGAKAEIDADLSHLADFVRPETDDEFYDRLVDRVMEWCFAHPDPVPHVLNPKLQR